MLKQYAFIVSFWSLFFVIKADIIVKHDLTRWQAAAILLLHCASFMRKSHDVNTEVNFPKPSLTSLLGTHSCEGRSARKSENSLRRSQCHRNCLITRVYIENETNWLTFSIFEEWLHSFKLKCKGYVPCHVQNFSCNIYIFFN